MCRPIKETLEAVPANQAPPEAAEELPTAKAAPKSKKGFRLGMIRVPIVTEIFVPKHTTGK